MSSNWDKPELRAAKARVYAEETTCYFCGRHVDPALSKVNPQHNAARSVHHLEERAVGGQDHRANLRLAHRICNTMGRGVPELLGGPVTTRPTTNRTPADARAGGIVAERHSESWGRGVPPDYVY